MRTRWTTIGALGILLLAGCGEEADDGGTAASTAEAPAATAEAPTDGADGSPTGEEAGGTPVLRTAETELGTIVVDGAGMTAYMFDEDTQGSGESACSGDCLVAWPPIVADSEEPSVEGVEGEVGTIERDDGTLQVTLEGWPLYLWQQDTAPGDVTGQAVGDVWWVISPEGEPIRTAPASPAG